MQLPASLIDDLKQVNGFEEKSFTEAHDGGAIISLRKHPVKAAALTLTGEDVPWCPGGLYLPERPVFTLDPSFHAGAYYVQEASSMFLAHVWKYAVPADNSLRVLDLCAAPGGKTTSVASLISRDSLLISNEVIRARASILEENVVRWGYMNNWVTCNDPRDFTAIEGYFDAIVIDAPCSGSGLFRKDPGALKEWSEANVTLCAGRQQRIIADIWPALKKGGVLIYATCSFSPQEDEDIIDHIAATYECEAIKIPLEHAWGVTETLSSLHKMYGYRFFPGKTRGEGFFIAAIKKNGLTGSLRVPKFKPQNTVKVAQQATHLLSATDTRIIQAGESFRAINSGHEQDWHLLQKAIYFRRTGLELGQPSAKEWIPAHEVALSIDTSNDLPHANVSREQALRFLKREEMDTAVMSRGWNIIKYNGLGLGWLKVMPNRANNHLPKHWRIRMNINEMDTE